ncbi:OmpA family protein [Rhodocytophaga rosea]|uniref:OmpA family protein n=1 Tax=Rhodocytophaga rosea TaxID=2704465 RepID=A0A6C0GUI9_9BACT|nr:OmpA family protein [Rhodocytophaga rosea]QHT71213.1 OmpA family protein [Rhodocytophaga rosea]
MAEINIEPKKKGFNWLWILGILALVGIVGWLLSRDRNIESDAAAMRNDAETIENGVSTGAADMWRDVDLNVPRINHPEIKINSSDFELRGNDMYTVYSMGEKLLFDTDQATIRSDARENLEQIVASIDQRYGQGQIRIYGHADARADAEHNKELSQQRAEAVKNWLVTNASMDASRISIHPMGEADPVASNQTKSGQQQNRRVEIVAMNP